MNEMGKRIRQMRQELGLTMEELGEKLGVKASAVNKWENGTVENIKRSTIQKMSILFGCSPVWLMGFEDLEPSPSVDSCFYTDDGEVAMVEIERSLECCNLDQLSVLQKYIDFLVARKELESAPPREMEF